MFNLPNVSVENEAAIKIPKVLPSSNFCDFEGKPLTNEMLKNPCHLKVGGNKVELKGRLLSYDFLGFRNKAKKKSDIQR